MSVEVRSSKSLRRVFSFDDECNSMGSKSCSRVKVSLRAREECKQKVLNRSNVIVTEKYNGEEQILLESFRCP